MVISRASFILTHFYAVGIVKNCTSGTRMAATTNLSYLIIQVLLLPRECRQVHSVAGAVRLVVRSVASCALQHAVSDIMHTLLYKKWIVVFLFL